MPDVFVGLGSNVDPGASLRAAVAALAERFGALRCSSVYRSAAIGVAAAPYSNLVVQLHTDVGVHALQSALREVETSIGRRRDDPAVVKLDLDLLLYGDRVDAALRLPRPGAFTLPFVVGPLAEIAPQLVHPLTGESCAAAWRIVGPGDLARVGSVGELR